MTPRAPGLAKFAETVRDQIADAGPTSATAVAQRAEQCAAAASVTRDRLHAQGLSPWDLPARSRHAFQWLALLSDPAAMAIHVDAQVRMAPAPRRFLALRSAGAKPALYMGSHLLRQRAGRFFAHQSYMEAPAEILEALPGAIRGRRARQVILAYAAGPEFAQVSRRLEAALGSQTPDAPGGLCVDLAALYNGLNTAYFGGALSQGRLRWSARHSYRRLGHYDPVSDTIVLSRSLDDPAVPPVLVEFVMYHEMLHKKLGVARVNGRLRAHTAAFRRAERQFADFAEASRLMREPLPRSGVA